MGIFCVQCERRVGGGLTAFKNHLQNHNPPYVCSEGECDRRPFSVRTSLYRHLREHHNEDCASSSESSGTDESGSSDESGRSKSGSDASGSQLSDGGHSNNDQSLRDISIDGNLDLTEDFDAHQLDFNSSLERAAARLILDLRKRGNVTGAAISVVIEETQLFICSFADAFKKEIATNLRRKEVRDDIIDDCVSKVAVSNPFTSLKTKDQQLDYFEKNFGLVKREPKYLGLRDDHHIDQHGVSRQVQIKKYFQYVPVTKILTAILNNKVLYKLIHSERQSTDGKMRSYLDGSFAREHPLISEFPHTIRINIHIDDFETVNPLGSKTSVHKITEVNFQIQNLPPEENARLRSVFVLAYAYREDLPEDGIGVMLEPFFLEMDQLETPDGVEVNVNGRPYTPRATLVSGSADALAAHEALGFYSPSCRRFCSLCTVLKKDFHRNIFATGAMRTKALHLFHLSELNRKSTEFMKANYGVERNTALLSKSRYAEFPEALIKDGMHDILKGIAPMEIKLALHEFCFVQKYFDVFLFNYRIQSFNFGPADSTNKPSPNFTTDSVQNKGCYTIHQSAAQTWCLLQAFPFLVGHLVPLNNPHLRLLVLLKRISKVIFSHVVSESNLQELEQVTHEHHQLFTSLYPPPQDIAIVEAEQDIAIVEAENEDDPDIHEDFLDEELSVANPGEEEENDRNGDAEVPPPQPKKQKRPPKVIRPINKHHHLLHYVDLMRKYGPAVLYWCMRFEGKHALPKRFGAIVHCYKNLPITFLDVQQMYQCAELLDLETEVRQEISVSKGSMKRAVDTPHLEALRAHGIDEEVVLEEVDYVKIAGFKYQKGLYVNLQLGNETPLFGLISHVYILNDDVYLVTKDVMGIYDERFDAFLIESDFENSSIRVLLASNLPPDRPMTAWTADSKSFFLSARRILAERLLQADQ